MSSDIQGAMNALLARTVEGYIDRFVVNIAAAYQEIVPRSSAGGAYFSDREPRKAPGSLADALVITRDGNTVSLTIDDAMAPHGKMIDNPVGSIDVGAHKVMAWFDGVHGLTARRQIQISAIHAGWWSQTFRNESIPQAIAQSIGRG